MPILAVVVNEPKFPQTLDGTRVTHLTSPFFRKATLSSVKESEGRSTQREVWPPFPAAPPVVKTNVDKRRPLCCSLTCSICENNGTVRPLRPTSREHSGSASVALREDELLYVTVRFNVSLRQRWVVYGYAYDAEMMEVSPPPGNVRASVRDVDLAVTWDAPRAAAGRHPACFQYQLDVGRQKKWTIRSGELSYTIPNVDRASDLSVRLRARKSAACLGSPSWSRWSNTVTIERSSDPLDITRTVWFALGIPVILVALFCLLRVHRLRVKEVLYPTIPRPPLKYKYFLDENNTFDFYLPATSVKCEEEITVVEDTEKQL
ncbi:interleukin-5 receptor subunit alpha-like isoform X6 [Phycodurus eques]|uniref:interleukin-5 receptor subunit alpha-like isoform X6 n=1 Tax=Phycodurus eques TaxID=693459 RepID=UPI002ACE7379|nr:interleukin-5 receptor subunit alpha-like isoform X6 [Phycodurus eques]